MAVLSGSIQIWFDDSAGWASDPVLLPGQPGLDTDTGELGFGDGTTVWSALSKYTTSASTIADQRLLGNISGSAAVPSALTPAQVRTMLDLEAGTDFNAYSAVLATLSGASANGQSLVTAANYAAMRGLLDLEAGTDFNAYSAQLAALAAISPSQGDVIYHNGTAWVRLAAGTSGQRLRTLGSSANPEWAWSTDRLPILSHAGSPITWTNMPAAATFLNGQVSRSVFKTDLTSYTAVRLVVVMSATVGATGSKLIVRYKTGAYDTTAANYSDIGTSEVSTAIDAAGQVDSGWIALASGAKADVQVTIIGSGGDGAADPVISSIMLEFR